MGTNTAIRITAVENGFLVGRLSAEGVASSFLVFATVETLTSWLREHFARQQDVPPPSQIPEAERYSPEEFREFSERTSQVPEIKRCSSDVLAFTFTSVKLYDDVGDMIPINDLSGREILGAYWGVDALGDKALVVEMGRGDK